MSPAVDASTPAWTGRTLDGPTPSRSRPSTASHTGPPPRSPDRRDHAGSATPESRPSPTPGSTACPYPRETSPQTPHQETHPDDARPGTRTCCPPAPDDPPEPARPEARGPTRSTPRTNRISQLTPIFEG